MEKFTLLVPHKYVSKEMVRFFTELGKFIQKRQKYEVRFQDLDPDDNLLKKIATSVRLMTLVTNYESIYLESFYEFVPLFKLVMTDIKGYLVVHKDAAYNHLFDLKGKRVSLPAETDWLFLNPTVLYLVQNALIQNLDSAPDNNLRLAPTALLKVKKKDIDGCVTTSFNFNQLASKDQRQLSIIAEFPLLPEYIVITSGDLEPKRYKKLKTDLAKWFENNIQLLDDIGLQHLPVNGNRMQASLVESIEGLGYTLNKFVEEYSDLLIKSISCSRSKELDDLNEKYSRLKTFNERLVKMYQDARDSRDRLSQEIESATEWIILFQKDGTILGVSRALAKYFKVNRKEIIGKDIIQFIEPSLKTPIKTLIQQIDVGLIRSFHAYLKNGTEKPEDVKIEFSIIELSDSKVIMGMINKKK